MEPAHLPVHRTPSVPDRIHEDLAGKELAPAEAALSAPAVGVDRDPGSLQRDGYRLGRTCRNNILAHTADDRDLIRLSDAFRRISGQCADVSRLSEDILTEAADRNAQLSENF